MRVDASVRRLWAFHDAQLEQRVAQPISLQCVQASRLLVFQRDQPELDDAHLILLHCVSVCRQLPIPDVQQVFLLLSRAVRLLTRPCARLGASDHVFRLLTPLYAPLLFLLGASDHVFRL